MELLAIIQLASVVVASLEGEGGELLRRLMGMADQSAQGKPLTPEQLAYLNEQREAAVTRLNASADEALARARLLNGG